MDGPCGAVVAYSVSIHYELKGRFRREFRGSLPFL
jgi:hypothetical protein